MIIKTSCPNFEPENFEILDFYNINTVFVWKNDQFAYFPLTTLTSAANSVAGNLKLIKAPSGIKKLKSYKERVFFICEPRENLDFKKIFFNCEINNCVGFIEENEDYINLIIGGDKIYFVTLKVSTGGVTYHSYLNEALKALRIVENKVWGLKAAGEMAEIAQEFNKMADQDGDEFFELRSSMCSGTSVIVDNICDLSKELKVKNEKLLIEQDKLKRINIYAHKSKLLGIKKIWVERTSSFIFLKASFEGTLPRDCWIRVGVSCKEQEFFTMQKVEDGKIAAELPLPLEFFDSTAEICLDLVTLVEEDKPWFVVKDCEKKASAKEKETLRSLMEKKRNFLNTKLGVLRTGDGDEDRFKKICYVKKSLRREIPDF
ncbi:hypothetical protein KQX54_015131 [Cotesia glomerata]|uniref:Uncharacterized protein n=1 Tax=Cotesia glomerata TaxID=32391 RepID=A0AAV7ISD4_COTGL|nr:hypothetical protein KQX54_015131 [Cotesia glomerata]